MSIVDPMLVGEVDTHARPFKRETDYGHVELSPLGAFEVRSLQTFKLIYTAGSYGVDRARSLRPSIIPSCGPHCLPKTC